MTLGLASVMALGVGVALNHRNEVRQAKADAPTWMFTATINLTATPFTWGDDSPTDVRIHIWNDNTALLDRTIPLHRLSDSDDYQYYYTANIPMYEGEVVHNCQFVFNQQSAVKYSGNRDLNMAKNSASKSIYALYTGFPGENWTIDPVAYQNIEFSYGDELKTVEAEPTKGRWIVKDIETTSYEPPFYVHFAGKNGMMLPLLRETDSAMFMGANDAVQMKGSYADHKTYDFIFSNEYSDGGILEVKEKAGLTSDTYIYYVLEDNVATNDYIYAWGGSNQFGAWPGTKITSVAGVQEVTNNGVLHFQGSETPKLIYKIPVTVGYPGDDNFKFNNNDTMETATRPINGHNAYWWSGDANSLAGYAIDFLVMAEGIRNAADDYSVCKISKENAAYIVAQYDSLGSDMQTTYINGTTVYTHKKDKTDGNELVSYHDIIEQLRVIAAGGGESNTVADIINDSNTAMIIAVVSSITVISALGTFFIIRRRKHN